MAAFSPNTSGLEAANANYAQDVEQRLIPATALTGDLTVPNGNEVAVSLATIFVTTETQNPVLAGTNPISVNQSEISAVNNILALSIHQKHGYTALVPTANESSFDFSLDIGLA